MNEVIHCLHSEKVQSGQESKEGKREAMVGGISIITKPDSAEAEGLPKGGEGRCNPPIFLVPSLPG